MHKRGRFRIGMPARAVFLAAWVVCLGACSAPRQTRNGTGPSLPAAGGGGNDRAPGGGAGGASGTTGLAPAGAGGLAGATGTAGTTRAGAAGAAGAGQGAPVAGTNGSAGQASARLYGFTLDSIDNLSDIVDSLRQLPKRSLVRIVFDYPDPPSHYSDAVTRIAEVADIVGQPSDSDYSKQMSVSEYGSRFEAYVSAFPQITWWEACNECNSDWGGPNTAAQADAAYAVIKAHGKLALYTPYWNTRDCADSNGEYLTWTRKNISDQLKQGADMVAVSIYGSDCSGDEPTYSELDAMFEQLGSIFPNAQLGVGEYGSDKASDKERILRYYLDYPSSSTRYVFWGGYWYGKQDFVPASKPLWRVFVDGMK